MADQKLTGLSAISQANVDDTALLYIVDVTGGNVSRKVTKGNLFAGTTKTQLVIGLPTGPTGSASVFYGGIKIAAATITFATTAQSNDYYTNFLDQATLVNPSSGIIPNAATLKIVGAPIASTNVTITNNYALWVASGNVLLQATGGSNPVFQSTADGGNNNHFIDAYNGASQFILRRANTSLASPTQVLNGNNIGVFVSRGYHSGNAFSNNVAQILFVATQDFTSSAQGTAMTFGTTPNGSTVIATALTLGQDQSATFAGDILFSTHNLKTSSNTFSEGTLTTVSGQAFIMAKSTANTASVFVMKPNGTTKQSLFYLNRVDDLTNWETLVLGTDINAVGEVAIAMIKSGTGTARPINIYQGATKLLSFDTANTITSYVQHNFNGAIGAINTATGSAGQYVIDYSGGALLTIANNATATPIGSATNLAGILKIINIGDGATAIVIVVEGRGVSLLTGSDSEYTTTSGTSSKTNIYLNSSVLTIENKLGSSQNYRVVFERMN